MAEIPLDSGVGVRVHPIQPTVWCPSAGHLWGQWSGDPWSDATHHIGPLSEDYQNKMDTISLLFSITCPPPPQRLCKDLIGAEHGQVWRVLWAHILTSLSFVSNDWSWFRHELPMPEVWQRKSDWVRGWPRQNKLTQQFVKHLIWFRLLFRLYISKTVLSWPAGPWTERKVADFIPVPT